MNQTEETYSGDSYWYHEDILNVTVSNSTSVFQSPLSPLVDKAISCITIIILFITMVSLGCTMEISKIKAHILKPKGVAIAVVAQYGIMPLTAFTLAKVFQLGSIESVTVLICGCCPGGNLSNIFALALKGDMNLRWFATPLLSEYDGQRVTPPPTEEFQECPLIESQLSHRPTVQYPAPKGTPCGVQDASYSLEVTSSSPGYSTADRGQEFPGSSVQPAEQRPRSPEDGNLSMEPAKNAACGCTLHMCIPSYSC
ncbi:UNVERIFIED_CONTAM: hypothetical protein FKN15_068282 [Acipenser sinensis]